MKVFTLFLFALLTDACVAQFKVTKLDKISVPKSISYSGKLVQAVRWADSTGDNIVLLTTTGKTRSKNPPDEGYSDGALYAYHYLVSSHSIKETWKVQDYVKACPVDLFLYFVDNAFAVTDLNKDGKAEVWIMYKVSCQGDVSPVPMKIIMYEGNKKYAVRGTTRVQVSEKEYRGGEYTLDEAFNSAPAAFKAHADKLWKQHRVETWKE